MIESFPINFNDPSQEKPKPESGLESLEPIAPKESFEFREGKLREGFAKELKKPCENSYLKTLKKVITPFVLAGLMTLVVPEKATLPEKSKDFKEFQLLDYYREKEPSRYLKVLTDLQKKIEEKGGIAVSPQLPEEVYKPERLYRTAQVQVGKEKIPYFSKPEIIFGEEFVKKNPEKAKEYFEKISKTQEATVIIITEKSMGSGVIINTEKGKIILTNGHVVEGEGKKSSWIEFKNGNIVEAKVLNVDEKNDIAILKIDLPEKTIKGKNILKGTNSLYLDSEAGIKSKENLALIGHPMGYPFEVSLAKVENVESELFQEENQNGFIDTKIISIPDERFAKLASYDVPRGFDQNLGLLAHKGESIWGMSGGPIIRLDKKGEPKLSGINCERRSTDPKQPSYFTLGEGVHAQIIGKFLEKSGYPAAVSGEGK